MASIFVKMAFGVRGARALRFLAAALSVAVFACLIAPTDASAQFRCNPDPPNPGDSVSCTNSASIPGPFNLATTGSGNATTNNSGNVGGGISATANGTGNATTINSGSADEILTETDHGGTATTINSGTAGSINNMTFDGGKSVVTNSGNVLNTSGFAGIQNQTVDGGNATTTNTGTVTGGIVTSAGTAGGDGNATTINYGTIIGNGIVTFAGNGGGAGNATTINYGTSNAGLQTISAGIGNAITINYGTVQQGLLANTQGVGNASAFNYGRVNGEVDAYADGIGRATITNAGVVTGDPHALAIDLGQLSVTTPTTLNILPGSQITGIMSLNGDSSIRGSGTQINIYSRNASSMLTFGGTPTCGCPAFGLVDTGATVNVIGGAPYVINGNTVAVLDPTSFTAQDRNVLDFTRTVLSAASSRLTSPAPMSGGDGSAAIGFAASGNVARDMANDAFANIPALAYANQDNVLRSNPSFTAADGTSVWAQGFGGVRVQNADGPNLRSVNQFYGGMLGVDKTLQPGLRVGAFTGGGSVSSQIDMNSGSSTSDMGFGGIYARYAMNRAFLDFALLGGGSSNNVKRTMTNNLVAGGTEFANGSYSGWFVSPELAYGVRQDLTKDWTITPTARVRYLAANFGGYQESGSSNNLTVAGRTAQNFEERGELVFTRTTSEREGSLLQINATLGALAWQRLGDATVNTVLLGQALAFATPGQVNVVGGYVGGGFEWRKASGLSVFAAAEVDILSDSSHTLSGRGGVKLAF